MRNLKRLKLLSLILLGLITCSCQNQDDYVTGVQEPISEVDTLKLIDFKGLPVNHRFKTPVEELETVHTEGTLKTMYNKARFTRAKKKGLAFKTVEVELPNPETIIEASSKVLEQFPYENSDNGDETSNTVDMDMITSDFPTLSKEEVVKNIEVIDEYYSQNLDYVVLNEVAENEEMYQNTLSKSTTAQKSASDWGLLWCTLTTFQNPWNIVVPVLTGFTYRTGEFSYIRSIISMFYSNKYAKQYSAEEYGNTSDNKGDAYKHILWNSFLAHYYWTVSSKAPRLRFAEAITYAYEDCSPNDADAREMDYHNNYIGRKLWDDNCGYRKWWWMTVGLRKPSISTLKTKAKALVEAGKFIDNRLGTMPSRAKEIKDNTSKYQVVYLKK